MLHKAFKGLLLFCDHPHIKLNLIMGMLSCEVFNQLHGLSLHHILVFNMDPYVLEPGLEDQICCGRITTLQFVNFWLMQLVKFSCSHFHIIFGWIYCAG